MKIVVTGGTGFIGGHLVDALVEKGLDDIWVIDNLFRGIKSNIEKHLQENAVTFVHGDIRDKDLLVRIFKDAEIVFHLAAQSRVLAAIQNYESTISINVTGTENVLNAAGKCGVRRVVFSSSREVYGESNLEPVCEDAHLKPKNAYGASKIEAEAYCKDWSGMGLETVILRFTNVYGTRDTDRVVPFFIKSIVNRDPLVVYGEDKSLDFIWIDDVVDVLMDAGFREDCIREPINIGSGIGIPIVKLAQRLLNISKADNEIIIASPREYEVNQFVANVERMHLVFGDFHNGDPLAHLGEVFHDWKQQNLKISTRVTQP